MQSSTQAGSIIGNNNFSNADHAKDNIKTNGEYKKYSDSGVLQLEENYNNGLLNGRRKTYHLNGKIETVGDYKDGKKYGEYVAYSDSGILLLKENFDNGLLHGERKYYHKNGKLGINEEYENGKRHGKHIEYSDSEILIAEDNYDDGLRNGKGKEYYSNGNILSIHTTKNGVFVGERKSYHLNGQTKVRCNYDNDGKEHGTHVKWDEEGNVIEEFMYNHGTQTGINKIRTETMVGKSAIVTYKIIPGVEINIISIKGEDGIEHVVPDGLVYVWKACRGVKNRNLYVKLEVPADAKRVTVIEYKKARISHGKVVEIIDDNKSHYGEATSFIFSQMVQTYKVGEIVHADSFDGNVNNSCSHGISVHYHMSECLKWF